MLPEFSLENRAALVTGGTRSLGRAAANVLAEAGADVAICGRWEEGLTRVKEEIESYGRKGMAVSCDIRDPIAVDELVDSCVSTFGRLDVLVANAGIFQVPPTSSESADVDQLNDVISVNLTGTMNTCLAAGKAMIEQGEGGSIITISSIQGKRAIPGTLSYVASKHGVIGLTKCLAVDWARHNIRVNAIAPAFIERDGNPLKDYPELVELVETRTPLGRQGQGRELGLAVAFLASPAASYITGTTLDVDGGWLTL